MNFRSDNAGPAHPAVFEALAAANAGHAPAYGDDALTASVADRLRENFEAPEAAVYLVATGTAANALILATLAQPWQTVFCSSVAHVHEDECAAPEFFTGGSKLTLVPHADGRMTPDALAAAIAGEETRGVHGPQRGPVTLTQATERGTIYDLDALAELTAVARARGLATHMDGARFANALVRLGCTPAEMTWKAGIDAVSFGGTKNGLLGVEAAILFDPGRAWEFELRRKRGAHLFSKHRYLAAQMAAYLKDELWLDMARAANAACDRLAAGIAAHPVARLAHPAEANMVFFEAPRGLHRRVFAAGGHYHIWNGTLDGGPEDEPLVARAVCNWATTGEEIDAFLAALSG